MIVFHILGQFQNICWYYVSIKDLQRLIFASLVCVCLFFLIKTTLFPWYIFSRMVPVLDGLLTILLLGGFRLVLRMYREDIYPRFVAKGLKNTLLVGANQDGAILASNIHAQPELGYRVVGFITIHEYKLHRKLAQIPVLGTISQIEDVVKKHHVTDVLMIAGIVSGPQVRELTKVCQKAGLNLRIVLQPDSRLGGKTVPIRDINIEDLLKREPIQLNNSVISDLIKERCVLVTGAGGSIGSEICRQLVRFQPEQLLILGRGENRIFFLENELREMGVTCDVIPIIADVTHYKRMNQVFDEYRPEVVFHAAAHKHVPLMEANVSEAVRNNILGTRNVVDLSDEYEVKKFVLVSTDKAVNPTSVMGTSKHLAERYVHAMSQASSTRFIVTRFGNVLGSTGSVVPIFRNQIQKGGPITVTDPEMTRYFMTIPEASQLVLQAAAMGKGGEIFVLDMGEQVRIVDLARDMIRLAGLPEHAVEIQYTGLRPGEKLYEELYFDSEQTLETDHPKLRAATHRLFPIELVQTQMHSLCRLLDGGSDDQLKEMLHDFVPEYRPFQKQQVLRSESVGTR
ncbi:MAG: polysaccharide biosynthesis protein [Planctomycetaceae bacterium]|nr:polysaccharide biosynthesis protein [Planctomycetaceae bacterium]